MADFILNPESEIVIFFGPRGRGKSTLMGHFLDEYLKTLATKRWELSEQLIREQNAKRIKPLSFPYKPPVYTNVKYKNLKLRSGEDFEPFPIKGKEIGANVEGDPNKYKYLFPAPLIVLDEAHSEFCPKGGNLPEGQLQFFMECRHNRVIMLLGTPRAVLINKNIRVTGSRFIEPRKVINEFDAFNRLCKTTWHCREFLDSSDIEEYIKTDGKSGNYVKTTYTHEGNIRKILDSYAIQEHLYPTQGEDIEK